MVCGLAAGGSFIANRLDRYSDLDLLVRGGRVKRRPPRVRW